MALYDPRTGRWYEYRPSTYQVGETEGQGGLYQESELTPVETPTGMGNIGRFVDPTGSASDIAARLLRAQFADWQNFFRPIELQAMQRLSFNNPEVLTRAVGEAKETAEGSFETMGGVLQRQNRALGIEPTSQQIASTRRIMDLNKALAVAGAANQARQNVRTQDEQILLGAVPNPNIVRSSN